MSKIKSKFFKVVIFAVCTFFIASASFGFVNYFNNDSLQTNPVAAALYPDDFEMELSELPTTYWRSLKSDVEWEAYSLQYDTSSGYAAGSIDNPYWITDVYDLQYLSYETRTSSSYKNFANVYFIQKGDIDLADHLWTPIGLYGTKARRFAGNFDGNGFKISNLYINETRSTHLGLFSATDDGAVIRNVKIEGCYINTNLEAQSQSAYLGSVVGYAFNTRFENITAYGKVTAKANYVGGIAGYVTNSSFNANNAFVDCQSYVIVRGETYVGGVVGRSSNVSYTNVDNYKTVTGLPYAVGDTYKTVNSYTGGVVGYMEGTEDFSFNNVTNYGHVTNKNPDYNAACGNYVGGLVGYSVSSKAIFTLDKCANYGKVDTKGLYAGGIGGTIQYSNMNDCHNYAEVFAGVIISNEFYFGYYVGGIVGRTLYSTIKNSTNKLSATITAANYYIGGIAGEISNGTTIENCHNYASVSMERTFINSRSAGGIAGLVTGSAANSYIINCTNGAIEQTGGTTELANISSTVELYKDASKDSFNKDLLNTTTINGSIAGGAIGYVSGAKITIQNFKNYGIIKTFTDVTYDIRHGAGGIIGYTSDSLSNINIIGSDDGLQATENFGQIIGDIVGGALANSYSANAVLNIDNFVNYADICYVNSQDMSDQDNHAARYVGGVVGYLQALTTITNTVNNADICVSSVYTGGIVAYVVTSLGVDMDNVVNKGDISSYALTAATNYVGGLIGLGRGELNNVTNLGSVLGQGSYIGGIIGQAYNVTITNATNGEYATSKAIAGESYQLIGSSTTNLSSYVGGLIGSTTSSSIVTVEGFVNYMTITGGIGVAGAIGRTMQSLTMSDVYNFGEVNSTSYYTAGLVATLYAGSLTIINCENNAQISGAVNVSNTAYSYSTGGLVGSITSTTARMTLTNSENNGAINGQFAGGIVGFNKSALVDNILIKNVINNGNVTSNPLSGYWGYAGGIIGTGDAVSYGAATLSNVINKGQISARFVGGIVSQHKYLTLTDVENQGTINVLRNNYTIATDGFGGIAYRVSTTAIFTNVQNSGTINVSGETVTGNSFSYAGGILGSSGNARFENVSNLANINLNGHNVVYGVGGLIGYVQNMLNININKSYNKGNINANLSSSHAYIGGLIGRIEGTIGRTVAANSITEITNSYVEADLIADNSYTSGVSGVAGLIGYMKSAFDINNCMVFSTIKSSCYQAGVVAYLQTEFNVIDGLPYIIRNILVDATFESTASVYSASMAGGIIGYLYFNSSTVTNQFVEEINVTIKDSIAVVIDNSNMLYKGGLLARTYYINTANRTGTNKITAIRSFYIVDGDEGYNNPSTLLGTYTGIGYEYTQYGHDTSVTEYDSSSSLGKLNVEEARKVNTYINWDFTGENATSDKVFWAISPTFNKGFPYLRNTFTATIIFHAGEGGAYFINDDKVSLAEVRSEDGSTFYYNEYIYSLDDFVGNTLTITDDVYTFRDPILDWNEFKGWALSREDAENGIVTYRLGETIDITNKIVHLYPVFNPVQLYLDLVTGGNLFNISEDIELESPLTYMYVSTENNDLVILPLVGDNETFNSWEVYNGIKWTSFSEDATLNAAIGEGNRINLTSILIDYLAKTYSFEVNAVRTIRIQQIISGGTEIVAVYYEDDASIGNGSVTVDNKGYEMGSSKIVTIDETNNYTDITITVKPNAYYTYTSFVVRDASNNIVAELIKDGNNWISSNNSILVVDSKENTYIIRVNARFNIYVKFERIMYTVNIEQKENTLTGTKIDSITLLEGYTDGMQVAIVSNLTNDSLLTTLAGINAITNNPDYRFVKFYAYNVNYNEWYDYTPGNITSDILSKYADKTTNEILIRVVFVRQYLITVTTDDTTYNGTGTVKVYAKVGTNDPTPIDFVGNQARVDAGTELQFSIVAAYNSSYAGMMIGTETTPVIRTSWVIGDDTSIIIAFDLAYYGLELLDQDNFGEEVKILDKDTGSTTILEDNIYISVDAVSLNDIVAGTRIRVLALNETNIKGYIFDDWYFLTDGKLYPMSVLEGFERDENYAVYGIDLTEDVITRYINTLGQYKDKLVIVARYSEECELILDYNAQMGDIEVYIVDGNNITLVTDDYKFVYGTMLEVRAGVTNSNFYKFLNFDGITEENIIRFTITSQEVLTINYAARDFEFISNIKTSTANGELTGLPTTYAVGETIVLTFKSKSGFELRSWSISDLSGNVYTVQELSTQFTNVSYSNNTLVINVDENWINTFGYSINGEIQTMMNSTYLTTLLIGGISIPLLLASALVLVIMNKKKKAQVKAMIEQNKKTEFGFNTNFVDNLKRSNTDNVKNDDKGGKK